MLGDNQIAGFENISAFVSSVYFVRCLTHTLWPRIGTLCPYLHHPIILTLFPFSKRVLLPVCPRDGGGTVGDIGMFISTLLT
jgi:hypothetical protein